MKKQKINISYVDYDEATDSLTLQSNKKTDHTLRLEDLFFVNLSKSNKVVGLEVLNVHSLLNISKEVLNHIKAARIKVTEMPEQKKIFINTAILSLNKEQFITIPPISTNLHTINAF